MKKKKKDYLKVVKISGKIINDKAALQKVISDFLSLSGNRILVHGGGVEIDSLMQSLSIEIKKIEGKRITDIGTLGATIMTCSILNSEIVSQIKNTGNCAVGVPEVSKFIYSEKRIVKDVDYQYVGDIYPHSIDDNGLLALLSQDIIPVIPSITFDNELKTFLNTNADSVAAAVAASLAKYFDVSLIYCSDISGVLSDVNDENSLIKHINVTSYTKLKEKGIITDGMIPKIESAIKSLKNGVKDVIITNSLTGSGTTINTTPL